MRSLRVSGTGNSLQHCSFTHARPEGISIVRGGKWQSRQTLTRAGFGPHTMTPCGVFLGTWRCTKCAHHQPHPLVLPLLSCSAGSSLIRTALPPLGGRAQAELVRTCSKPRQRQPARLGMPRSQLAGAAAAPGSMCPYSWIGWDEARATAAAGVAAGAGCRQRAGCKECKWSSRRGAHAGTVGTGCCCCQEARDGPAGRHE